MKAKELLMKLVDILEVDDTNVDVTTVNIECGIDREIINVAPGKRPNGEPTIVLLTRKVVSI